jgi:hypothetical protein
VGHKQNFNKLTIDSYKIEGNVIYVCNKNKKYKIEIKKHIFSEDTFRYYGEVLNQYGFYEPIKCITKSQENKYPKNIGYIGSLFADKLNAENISNN